MTRDPPQRRRPAVDEREPAEDPAGDHARLDLGEQVRPRAPAEQDRLVGAQQARRRQRRGARAPLEVDQPVARLHELAGDRLQPGARVAQRQAGPASEVGVIRRSMTGQIAAGQLARATARSIAGLGGSQSPTSAYACWRPIIGPRTTAPSNEAANITWMNAWPSVGIAARRSRSRSAGPVIGPLAASSRRTSAIARRACAGLIPFCASRVRLVAASGGVVTACSQK